MPVKKTGPKTISETQLVLGISGRVGNGFASHEVREIVRALKEEIVENLLHGDKVTLSGLLTVTPTVKAGRKKGTVVRNPFDGTTKTLTKDEPDKFRVKAKVSPSVANSFPTTKTVNGQALKAKLAPKKR